MTLVYSTVLKSIDNPIGYKGLAEGGFTSFVSNLVNLIIALAGIFFLTNLISAGYQYLSSNGNAQQITNAGNKIIQSLIGLAIVATAFVIAALLGWVLFKNTNALLSPQLFSQ